MRRRSRTRDRSGTANYRTQTEIFGLLPEWAVSLLHEVFHRTRDRPPALRAAIEALREVVRFLELALEDAEQAEAALDGHGLPR